MMTGGKIHWVAQFTGWAVHRDFSWNQSVCVYTAQIQEIKALFYVHFVLNMQLFTPKHFPTVAV